MIEMNIQMNRDGTYDAEAIIGRAIELTAQSVLQVGLPLQLQAFGQVLQRAGNLFGMRCSAPRRLTKSATQLLLSDKPWTKKL